MYLINTTPCHTMSYNSQIGGCISFIYEDKYYSHPISYNGICIYTAVEYSVLSTIRPFVLSASDDYVKCPHYNCKEM